MWKIVKFLYGRKFRRILKAIRWADECIRLDTCLQYADASTNPNDTYDKILGKCAEKLAAEAEKIGHAWLMKFHYVQFLYETCVSRGTLVVSKIYDSRKRRLQQ